ncbi:MAG: Sulfur carrier protein FdhD [Promethearchaeota archaeon]|nr:MAG: Sulfur carrier protein FdhD [Candidatus Lokiarchaeota archaeon]
MFKRKIEITRIKKHDKTKLIDEVLIEQSVNIFINSEPIVDIICLPKDLRELAIGFLYSVGIIDSFEEIKSIEVDEIEYNIYVDLQEAKGFNSENLKINSVSRVIDTTCGITSPWRDTIKKVLDEKNVSEQILNKNPLLNADQIYTAIKQMQTSTSLYRETGGCHGAAIYDFNTKSLSLKEDIGRHNAIDKVLGDLLQKNHNFQEVLLTSTGRLTGDSVLKAIRAQIPIVASVSAAIESGIRLAFAYGITLIGFVRGARMNIYTHPERIQI